LNYPTKRPGAGTHRKRKSPDLGVTGFLTNPTPRYPFGYEGLVKESTVRAIVQRIKDGDGLKLARYQEDRKRLKAAWQRSNASKEGES